MRTHVATLKKGIGRSKEFEKKGLAKFAVNVGTKCGHDCLYCSTGAMLRAHRSFKAAGESPYGTDFSIVDPNTSIRVAQDAKRKRSSNRGLVQLCTTTDAWAPEAQAYDLGRKCLKAILTQPGWSVRVLTKNAAVTRDFGLIKRYRDRVLVGLSLTGTPDKSAIMAVLEPNASSIKKRMAALREAKKKGLRTYGMLCPLLPGIADAPGQIDKMVRFVVGCGVEEIFCEPVNARGNGLIQSQTALAAAGYKRAAAAVGGIRKKANWSRYTLNLVRNVQASVRRHFNINKLRFLLYPSGLLPQHEQAIRAHSAGVIWL